QEIQKYEEAYTGTRDALMKEEEKLREMRRTKGNEENLRQLEVKEIEFRLETENIMQKLRQDYNFDPAAVVQSEGQEAGAVPQDFVPEAAEEQAMLLRERIERIGEVNLVAVDEYQRLKERYLFLKDQTEDLSGAETNLNRIVEEIEKECKSRFTQAFEKIKENFESIYQKLFEGGSARIFLTNPDNPLETGIEIEAQPPGKTLRNIMQLSDGERCLTAISLLFAIFLAKPSPFCFMDEIDAPLDETNILKFTKLLKEFSRLSQFIVITHNKRTMEAANILYGITMEEVGVSKIVSVKMGEPVPV
ncbi:chromosome segregation protein SMC, partial [Candidatus Desantisbacteria bacterium CG02_land_8_20_14_3_00_49_13]